MTPCALDRSSHVSLSAAFSALLSCFSFFFFNDTATTEIYTLSLHDALPILSWPRKSSACCGWELESFWPMPYPSCPRSEEHTSELQSRLHLVCRLLLEKKKKGRSEGILSGFEDRHLEAAERRPARG